MHDGDFPDWEQVLSAAAHLQQVLPGSVLVGGTAAAFYAGHRFSCDADHVVVSLRDRFNAVLADLEQVAGWNTARRQRPVLILGNLDGIDTGVRQLRRQEPLETQEVEIGGESLVLPTPEEMLRIKAALILSRNATRDYLDFVALQDHLGHERAARALRDLDRLYPQPDDQSALQQLYAQLAQPLPYDLEEVNLSEYKGLRPPWNDWAYIHARCVEVSLDLFDALEEDDDSQGPSLGSG